MLALAIGNAQAGYYKIAPSPTMLGAYQATDLSTGNVIAVWWQSSTLTAEGPVFTNYFYDPNNRISVHMNANGVVTDFTLN
jgi:hypothetical protein